MPLSLEWFYFSEIDAVDKNDGPEGFTVVHFHDRCMPRHDHHDRYAQLSSMVAHGQRMITGAGSDDASRLLVLNEIDRMQRRTFKVI